MSHPAEALLAALEAVDLGAAEGRVDELAALLIERQQILDQLQKVDVSPLDETSRAQLRTRMQMVVERDAGILRGLHEALETTRKDLERAASGRLANRRYGPPREPTGRLIREG